MKCWLCEVGLLLRAFGGSLGAGGGEGEGGVEGVREEGREHMCWYEPGGRLQEGDPLQARGTHT